MRLARLTERCGRAAELITCCRQLIGELLALELQLVATLLEGESSLGDLGCLRLRLLEAGVRLL